MTMLTCVDDEIEKNIWIFIYFPLLGSGVRWFFYNFAKWSHELGLEFINSDNFGEFSQYESVDMPIKETKHNSRSVTFPRNKYFLCKSNYVYCSVPIQ